MLEKLAGRLKWEHADQGIRIEIPASWSWLAVSAAAVVAGGALEAWQPQWSIPSDESRFRLGVLSAAIVAAGACAIMAWACWSFTGRTIVTVNPHELKIQRRVLGIEWDTRRFATSDVRNLRYLPPKEIWVLRTDTDPSTSKIQFQASGKTIRFASGITEREACALFDHMEDIYKFPRDSELDQVAAARKA
jgi:hypothetical protein